MPGLKENTKHITTRNLPRNSRFYILLFSFFVSLGVAGWLRLQIPSDQLYFIRLQQVFAFASAAYLYLAIIATPLSKLFPGRVWMDLWLFSRRAIGVSAAYFASLHALVAVWAQMGGWSGLMLLPELFKLSLLLGLVALIVLLAMAFTSFDKVIAYMTFPHWKRLHRLIYIGGILIILHSLMIGTHVSNTLVQAVAGGALLVLFGLESLRIGNNLGKKYQLPRSESLTAGLVIWITAAILLLLAPAAVTNYHSKHENTPGHVHGAEVTND